MFLKNKIKDSVKNPHLILNILKNKILFFYKLHIVKDDTAIALAKWFKDEGDKNHRLNYPLTSESIVFDLGGYKGDFAAKIYDKFNCYVNIFEPVKEYYLYCENRFERNKKAAEYLKKTYPDIITIFHRDNGMPEVKLTKLPRVL
jgi:hypothetical protein